MSFDWNDYSADSGTEDVPLLLSTRSQSLILAAMQQLDSRFNWEEIDDSTWDDISAAVGEAYEEIMEVQILDSVPVGTIMAYTSVSVLPDKWLFCDGADILQSTYPDLYALIGTTFGTPAAGLFTLPNMAHRFPLGESDPVTLKPAIGAVGGEEFHTLTIFEIPAHTHSIAKGQAVAAQNSRANQSNNTALADQQTGSTGGGAGHNNMPPYLALAWIIKALP